MYLASLLTLGADLNNGMLDPVNSIQVQHEDPVFYVKLELKIFRSIDL